MSNDDVYTLAGRRVVDAPQQLAQLQPDDALSSMYNEVQSSWMRQSGDTQKPEDARNCRPASRKTARVHASLRLASRSR